MRPHRTNATRQPTLEIVVAWSASLIAMLTG